ncbi:hypothetical protein G6F60_015447 [Rhizopus arrhizus]|nr:hypothetical protein G6F60_015447 [Rhizopus arrhizus]
MPPKCLTWNSTSRPWPVAPPPLASGGSGRPPGLRRAGWKPGGLRTSSTVEAEKSPAIRLGMPSAVAPRQVIRSLGWCWRAVASSGSGRSRAT